MFGLESWLWTEMGEDLKRNGFGERRVKGEGHQAYENIWICDVD